jgi:hypothetical protein
MIGTPVPSPSTPIALTSASKSSPAAVIPEGALSVQKGTDRREAEHRTDDAEPTVVGNSTRLHERRLSEQPNEPGRDDYSVQIKMRTYRRGVEEGTQVQSGREDYLREIRTENEGLVDQTGIALAG